MKLAIADIVSARACLHASRPLHRVASSFCRQPFVPCQSAYHSPAVNGRMTSQQPSKRPRLEDDSPPDPALIRMQRAAFLSSMSRDISPPRSSRATPDVETKTAEHRSVSISAPNDQPGTSKREGKEEIELLKEKILAANGNFAIRTSLNHRTLPSPISLTKIRDLPVSANIDTVSIHDILGNPLLKEVWIFNFCFDVNWLMQFFDSDVRALVKVKIIHGSWRQEDGNRIAIEEACRQWPNVEHYKAYLPDQFGTHHSKMFVMFSHDDTAEVIIHTANMLMKDWTNMTQAVWRSGPLEKVDKQADTIGPIGSGTRFKQDLLSYLKAYGKTAKDLHKQLQDYDFSHIRGALVGSVPLKLSNNQKESTEKQQLWGYLQLREVLSHVEKQRSQKSAKHQKQDSSPHLVIQVSSIATLPNKWLENLVQCTNPPSASTQKPYSIIYPTPSNVAASLDGYAAGGSIHTKTQSASHLNQIAELKPHLCQWTRGPVETSRAERELAAPHIKTYIQYNQKPTAEALRKGEVEVDWALLTSANLSVQAWGSLPRASGGDKGQVVIQSFEIGVLVWPELFDDDFDEEDGVDERQGTKVRMVPVFGRDTPTSQTAVSSRTLGQDTSEQNRDGTDENKETLTIGLRIPYDLPLTPYTAKNMPWSPGGVYMQPDSQGGVWNGVAGR